MAKAPKQPARKTVKDGPSYDASVRESKARDLEQAPMRKKLEKLRTVDGLAKLVAASHASFATLPWLQWIFNAARTVNLRYASVSDEPEQQAALVRVLEELIDHGVAFDQIDEAWQWSDHALASLIDFEEVVVTDRNALLARALERGVDPTVRIQYPVWQAEHGPFAGYVVTRSALDAALASEHPELIATLKPYVNADAWPDAYLHAAIGLVVGERKVARLDEWSTWLDRAGDLDRVMTKLGSAEAGALVHFLCGPGVAPEYLERVIARLDPSLATRHPLSHLISTHFGAGFTMRTPVGATPLDMVETTAGVAKRAQASNAKKANKDYRADETDKLLAYTARKRALLEGAGAKRSTAKPLELPEPLRAIAEQLTRLATKLGVETDGLREAMAALDATAMGPWSFLQRVMLQFEADLLPAKLVSAELHELLGIFSTDRWYKEFSKKALPTTPKVEMAVAFHESDDGTLLVVKVKSGTEVWHIAPGTRKVKPRAKSVADYLAKAIDRADIRT